MTIRPEVIGDMISGSHFDLRWKDEGLDADFFEITASWIGRDTGAPGGVDHYWLLTSKLVRLCSLDYSLNSIVFIQSAFALEAMLRVHFRSSEESFGSMLNRAFDEGLIADRIFNRHQILLPRFERFLKRVAPPYAAQIVALIRGFRNDYAHGNFIMCAEMLYLAVHVREIADQLTMTRTPSWKGKVGWAEEPR